MKSKKLTKLEDMIGVWFKPMPHLPDNAKKWVAINLWWLSIFGVITLVVTNIFLTYLVIELLDLKALSLGSISIIITLLLSFVSLLLLSLSIKPLKSLKKRGWQYLLLVLLVNFLTVVVGSTLSLDMAGAIVDILRGSIGIIVVTYLLFEIRLFFVTK